MTVARPGVWAAALTRLNPDGDVDLAGTIAHQRRLLDQGCDGIAVLGTTGEANSFTLAERLDLIAATAEAGRAASSILIGTGCCALGDTVALSRAALEAGFNNTLMLPPFYYKGVSDDGLFAAYAETIERIGDAALRIHVYDFPKMTGLEIGTDLLVRLHEAYPATIVGIKDSSGRIEDMLAVAEAIPGFATYAGSEQFMLPVLRAGGAGCISATINVTARLAAAAYAAWQTPEADAAQDRLSAVRTALEAHGGVPMLKALMAHDSGDRGWNRMRPPLLPLGADAVAALLRTAAEQPLQPAIAAE